MKAERVFACDAQLGEGASWDVERQKLWWVDILGKRLFCGDPATGQYDQWAMDTEIGAAVKAPDGKRALVLRDRVELFTPETSARQLVWQGSEPTSNRFNDAGVDSYGTLWIGSMDFDAEAPTGVLWRVGADGWASKMADGISVIVRRQNIWH
jgi:xylono-1,5-lactonase